MGNNTLTATSTGSIVLAADINQFRTALIGDIFPRNSSGEVAASVSTLGSSTYPFSTAYVGGINIGTATGASAGDVKLSGVAYLTSGSSSFATGQTLTLSEETLSDGGIYILTARSDTSVNAADVGTYIICRRGTDNNVVTLQAITNVAVAIDASDQVTITNNTGADRTLYGSLLRLM